MPAGIEILELLQIVLLVAFLVVTGLFLVLAVVNRRRMHGALVSVPMGPFFGLPLRPIAFAGVLLCILLAGVLAGASISPLLIAGYAVGAALWGLATYLSTSIFVYDFGIVRGLIDRDAYLPWGIVTISAMRRIATVYSTCFSTVMTPAAHGGSRCACLVCTSSNSLRWSTISLSPASRPAATAAAAGVRSRVSSLSPGATPQRQCG